MVFLTIKHNKLFLEKSNLRIDPLQKDKDFEIINISDIENKFPFPYRPATWGVYGILWTGSRPYKHMFEETEYEIPEKNLLFIGPHKANSFVKGDFPDAVLIIFRSVFFARSTREAYILQTTPLFHKADRVCFVENKIYANRDTRRIISGIFKAALKEEKEGLNSDLVHSLISINILYSMTKMKVEMENLSQSPRIESTDYDIAIRFRKKVFENFKTHRFVSFYAKELNISERNLRAICKKAFNQTPKELITDIVLDTSCRMLSNTDLSVKEITFDLGFTEETNFISFFKKAKGVTPHNYRKRYNKHRLFRT